MNTKVKATNLELTSSLQAYLDRKLGVIKKLIHHFDEEGAAECWVEIGRRSRHHRKGEVFRAEVTLRLPRRVLRAEESSFDVRSAIDLVEDKLRREVAKYKLRSDDARAARRRRRFAPP